MRTTPHRRGLLIGGALLLVLSVIAALLVYGRAGHRESVLVVAEPVAAGHVVSAQDVKVGRVAGVTSAIPADDLSSVVGQVTTVGMVPGQVVTKDMVAVAPVPAAGRANVGLSLQASQVPGGALQPGDAVSVVEVAPAGSNSGAVEEPVTLSDNAVVFDVVAADGSRTSSGSAPAAYNVTITVDVSDASSVAAASSVGRVALVQTSDADRGSGAR